MDSKQLVNDIINKKFSKARDTIHEELVDRIVAEVESMGPEVAPSVIHEKLGLLGKAAIGAGAALGAAKIGGKLAKGAFKAGKAIKKFFSRDERKKRKDAKEKRKSDKLADKREKSDEKAAHIAMKGLLKMRKERDKFPEDSEDYKTKQGEIDKKQGEYVEKGVRVTPREDETQFMTKSEKKKLRTKLTGADKVTTAKDITKGDGKTTDDDTTKSDTTEPDDDTTKSDTEPEVDQNKEKIDALQKEIEELRTKIEPIQDEFKKLTQEGDTNSQKERDELETQIKDLTSDIQKREEQIKELKGGDSEE